MIILNGFHLLTIITKHSILDVAAVLDPPLLIVQSYKTLKDFSSPLHRQGEDYEVITSRQAAFNHKDRGNSRFLFNFRRMES